MNTPVKQSSKGKQFSQSLLAWYDKNARSMAWRVPPEASKQGQTIPPYFTWMSEVMLQQTQVATVKAYFEKFTTKWPTVHDLAKADSEEVMKAWAGLGYYSRARNLKKCAEVIVSDFDGNFPQEVELLKKLPGIGDYTACAIASIAFGKAEPVVDGNVERVISRQYCLKTPMPEGKGEVREIVSDLLAPKRAGDFAQAMMDLGATICSPKKPKCDLCPVQQFCSAFKSNSVELYPAKLPKKTKPTRKGAAFVIQNDAGDVYLQKRPPKGLLGGMSEVPTTQWDSNNDGAVGEKAAPFKAEWISCAPIRHTFTHFHLELEVWHTTSNDFAGNGWWSSQNDLEDEALPTVMTKVIKSALEKIKK